MKTWFYSNMDTVMSGITISLLIITALAMYVVHH